MGNLQQRKTTPKGKAEIDRNLLSVVFGKGFTEKELTQKDEEKIGIFERGLEASINKTDTIEDAVGKIVKTALACEFGPSFVIQKGAEKMIKTISHGIITDPSLRKQALIIMDRFAAAGSPDYIKVKGASSRKAN